MLGGQSRCGVGAGVDLVAQNRHDQIGPLREVSIDGVDTHPACSAISRIGASTPHVANTIMAVLRSA